MSSTGKVLLAAVVAGLLGIGASLLRYGLPRPADAFAPAPSTPVAGMAVGSVGDAFPADLILRDLSGTSVNVHHRFAGRPLLINFWASWCGPCIEEMPALQQFSAEQGDNGIQVLGVALDEATPVAAFIKRMEVTYPILLDSPGPSDSSVRLGNAKGVLPYSVLIGADGRIRKQKLGPFEPSEIANWAR